MANKYRKKFKITSHKEKANKNYTGIPFYPSHNVYHQENKQQMLTRM
jgi:hypothetical protein